MNWLLVRKGNFTATGAGPELRYLQLGKELNDMGDMVTILGRSFSKNGLPEALECLELGRPWRWLHRFFKADRVVVHGGGPVLMLLAFVRGLTGRSTVLDAYAPHWLELYEGARGGRISPKRAKISFNLFRVAFGAASYDAVLVANTRQLDLVRGVAAASGSLSRMERVSPLSFGAEENVQRGGRTALVEYAGGAIGDRDRVVGWLGGVWDWFDYEAVARAYAKASRDVTDLRFVFFGADDAFVQSFSDRMRTYGGDPDTLVFLPWVRFPDRFRIWSGFDLAVVWGGEGLENDYASRTRNFDCLSLGLPILQNADSEWSTLLQEAGAGEVADASTFGDRLSEIVSDRSRLDEMASNMEKLRSRYTWRAAANRLQLVGNWPPIAAGERLTGMISAMLLAPAIVLGVVASVRQLNSTKRAN